MPGFADIPLEDIKNKYIDTGSVSISKTGVERNKTNIDGISNEDLTLNEGNIYYDIIFRAYLPGKDGAYIGLYINVEVQNAYYKGYPIEKRGAYYAARRLSSQLKSINNDVNYSCLEKVFSIWICMGDVPNKEANTATLYRMGKHDIIGTVEREQDDYDLMNVIVLRVNDKIRPEDEVLGLLQVLCSNFVQKQQKLELLQEYGIRVNDDIMEGVNDMCDMSDLVEARGEARGKEEKSREMALEMLCDGMPHKKVAQYAQVSVETLMQWQEEACCKA